MLLTAKDIGFHYPNQKRILFENVNFQWQSGEGVFLSGPPGGGKTTLGYLIKGFIEPTYGAFHIIINKEDTHIINKDERLKIIGWVGARPEDQLFAPTVFEDVAYGLKNQEYNTEDIKHRVEHALNVVGLVPVEFAPRHPLSLSGGERRRAALAGIIALDYPFYIFDQPTAGLDDAGCEQFISICKSLRDEGRGFMWMGYDEEAASEIVDFKWTLKDSQLICLNGGLKQTLI
ncbi:MAG: ABC transporter ATP-binding protein [Calditrichota bacterium]